MKLKGKIALITGSSNGIGAALAKGFAAEGADIIVNYFSDENSAVKVAQHVERLGQKAIVIKANVGSASDVESMFKQIREKCGRLDILVNNVGIASMGPFKNFTENDWDNIIDTNLKSVFLCCKAALLLIPPKSAILNISSLHAANAMKNCSIYAASKGGLEAFTRGLAVDFADRGVRVNALRPGLISTDREPCNPGDSYYEKFTERILVGRVGIPADIVPAAVLLCSDDGGFITGQTICVDGGQGILLSTPYPKGFIETGAKQRI